MTSGRVDEVHGGISRDLAVALPNASAIARSAKVHPKSRVPAAQRSRLFKASSPITRAGLSGPPARVHQIRIAGKGHWIGKGQKRAEGGTEYPIGFGQISPGKRPNLDVRWCRKTGQGVKLILI